MDWLIPAMGTIAAVSSAIAAASRVSLRKIRAAKLTDFDKGRRHQQRIQAEVQQIAGALGAIRASLMRAEWHDSVMTSTLVAEASAFAPVGPAWVEKRPGRDYEMMVRGLQLGVPFVLRVADLGEDVLVTVYRAASHPFHPTVGTRWARSGHIRGPLMAARSRAQPSLSPVFSMKFAPRKDLRSTSNYIMVHPARG